MSYLKSKLKHSSFIRSRDIKEDPKRGDWGHPRSSAMSPFDTSRDDFLFNCHRSYSTALYRFWDIASYLSKFIWWPCWGDPIWISRKSW